MTEPDDAMKYHRLSDGRLVLACQTCGGELPIPQATYWILGMPYCRRDCLKDAQRARVAASAPPPDSPPRP